MSEEGGRDNSFLGYSLEEWGATARQQFEIAQRRFSLTHGPNLGRLLTLSDGELGEFCWGNPVISRVILPKAEFWRVVEEEKTRRWLKEWARKVPFLSAAEEFELSLFTDSQELVCGIQRSEEGIKKKVIRGFRAPVAVEEERLRQRIESLRGLIPPIECFLDENEVLVLVDFIEGREPTDKEIEVFKEKLRERGFKPEDFDLNKGNLKVDENGNIVLVDMEDIILG